MKVLFFDLGTKGAFSIFDNNNLKKIISFQIERKEAKQYQTKILAFQNILKRYFSYSNDFDYVATFIPYGLNRNTIINLTMMATVLILFFSKSSFCLLNEWNVWKDVLKQTKIPKRKIKKELTINWAEKNFTLSELNDDQADALLGGFFLINNKN